MRISDLSSDVCSSDLHDIGQLFGERVRLAREGVAEVHVPPGGGLGNVPAPAYEQIMAGGELADAFDDAGVVRHVAEGEIVVDGLGADAAAEARMGEEAL